MSLYEQWQELINGQNENTIDEFWKEYSEAETKIYTHILENYKDEFKGNFKELAEKFQVREVIFMGFLDGINTSLTEELALENIDENSHLDLKIDFEKLYFNMFKADADYLFSLDQWHDVLTEEKRRQIYKDYKRSKTVVVGEKIGRNDPCPCGSGKKYKKCCGAGK